MSGKWQQCVIYSKKSKYKYYIGWNAFCSEKCQDIFNVEEEVIYND